MVLSLNLNWFQVYKIFLQNCDNWLLTYLLYNCNSDVTVDTYSHTTFTVFLCVLMTIAVHRIYKFSDFVTFCFIDLLLLII